MTRHGRSTTMFLFLTALLLSGCVTDFDGPGGSSVSGNGLISGRLYATDNTPAIGARAHLIPIRHDPRRDAALPASHTVYTDSTGFYRFTITDTGEFNLQAIAIEGGTTLLTGIHVSRNPVLLPADTLDCPGVIKITLPDGFNPDSGYAFIPGTLISADATKSNDPFLVLEGVPSGVIQNVIIAADPASARLIQLQDIVVTPGDTSLVVNYGWLHSQSLYLNTTSRGAGIDNAVLNFPVFIRLGQPWTAFPFSEAAGNGADIRFAKNDGTPLCHEIECWDSLNNYAELWVTVDTIFGNNDSQCIVMYWGNRNAANVSSGANVFDTSRGFQGVWHLETTSSDTVFDATANRYNGVVFPAGALQTNPWNIGAGRFFDGTGCFTVSRDGSSRLNAPADGNYSVFAWVYVEKPDTAFRVIAGKGSNHYTLAMGSLAAQPAWKMIACTDSITPAWQSVTDENPLRYNSWNLLCGICRNGQVTLYVNGAPVSAAVVALPDFPSIPQNSGFFAIGGYASSTQDSVRGGGYFYGIIDEVQFHDVARNADWIRLYYQNQQIADSLIVPGLR